MAVYRFRVAFEDNEDVYREIEIKSTQNFADFQDAIVQSIDFDNTHDASFFISDNLWRKGDEIAKREMSKCKMASLIDDPHQKFVYIYDPKTAWTFFVELVKIAPDDATVSYPRCVKTAGDAPTQYKNSNAVPVVLEDDELDDEPHTDEAAYVNAHSADEVEALEGEEGEEEAEETDETPEEETSEEDELNTEGVAEEDY